MANIRIAVVHYENYDTKITNDVNDPSIGSLIDEHIRKTYEAGGQISEVSLQLEEHEQHELARMYQPLPRDWNSTEAVEDDSYVNTSSRKRKGML